MKENDNKKHSSPANNWSPKAVGHQSQLSKLICGECTRRELTWDQYRQDITVIKLRMVIELPGWTRSLQWLGNKMRQVIGSIRVTDHKGAATLLVSLSCLIVPLTLEVLGICLFVG